MVFNFKYTRHQTACGAKADAEKGDKLYLIKNSSQLRLTYQIRMLTYMAHARKKKLVIQLPKETKVHLSLQDFIREWKALVKIERA